MSKENFKIIFRKKIEMKGFGNQFSENKVSKFEFKKEKVVYFRLMVEAMMISRLKLQSLRNESLRFVIQRVRKIIHSSVLAMTTG